MKKIKELEKRIEKLEGNDYITISFRVIAIVLSYIVMFPICLIIAFCICFYSYFKIFYYLLVDYWLFSTTKDAYDCIDIKIIKPKKW